MNNLDVLIRTVCDNFKLDINGLHGIYHWRRVEQNGKILHKLLPETDLTVITLFAYIHDSQRICEDDDDLHGPRASEWAIENLCSLVSISNTQLEELVEACYGHTSELFSENLTIQACWDADRLDIGRCKHYIDRSYLGTPVAKIDNVLFGSLLRSRHRENI